jgi:DNA polymerase elongation subunit (family B)
MDLLVSVNQRNIKKMGRLTTERRRREITTNNSCNIDFPIVKNRNKCVRIKNWELKLRIKPLKIRFKIFEILPVKTPHFK